MTPGSERARRTGRSLHSTTVSGKGELGNATHSSSALLEESRSPAPENTWRMDLSGTQRSLLFVAGCLLFATAGCASSHPPPPPPPSAHATIEGWERRHPAASQELGDWVRNHSQAAQSLFLWDSHHPGANIDAFVASHPSWNDFNWILAHHRPAANSFMAWCRRHPGASRELMHYPGGLHWAGTHLYESYWDMKSAGH